MARIDHLDTNNTESELFSMDENFYKEPNSVHISDDWDTLMEDFLDDFDDYNDLNFPDLDDEL